MKVYVASSWRNDYQPDVVRGLRDAGHDAYDFRDPDGDGTDCGFAWSDIDRDWQSWDTSRFIESLDHEFAVAGFAKDRHAMQWAEACVLVMPCGRSAHLEAGYFVGAGKPLFILLSEAEPELMYKMASGVFGGLGPLLLRLQEIQDVCEGVRDSHKRRHDAP